MNNKRNIQQRAPDILLMLDVARRHGFSLTWHCYLGARQIVWTEIALAGGHRQRETQTTLNWTQQTGGRADGS